MKTHPVDMLMTLVKAILIVAAILLFGRFFGLNVREAGGSVAAEPGSAEPGSGRAARATIG